LVGRRIGPLRYHCCSAMVSTLKAENPGLRGVRIDATNVTAMAYVDRMRGPARQSGRIGARIPGK